MQAITKTLRKTRIARRIRKTGMTIRVVLAALVIMEIAGTVLTAMHGRRVKRRIRAALKNLPAAIKGKDRTGTKEKATEEDRMRQSAEETESLS